MLVVEVARRDSRQVHCRFGIEVPEALGNDEGEVGGDEGDVECPRLPVPGRIAQVGQRGGLGPIIHLDLLGAARTRLLHGAPRAAGCDGRALGPVPDGMASFSVQVAGQLRPEAVQLVRAVEMLFAGQDDIVTDGPEPVRPSHCVGGEGRGVVPGAGVVDVPPGHEGHAGRCAERRVAVGVLEDDTFGGEAIQVGCLDQGMAIGTAEHGSVLIGHDKQQVGPLGRRCHASRSLPVYRQAQRAGSAPVCAGGKYTVSGGKGTHCRGLPRYTGARLRSSGLARCAGPQYTRGWR